MNVRRLKVLFALVTATAAVAALSQSAPPPVVWTEGKGYRMRELKPAVGPAGFVRLTGKDTGVQFTNLLDEARAANNRILENGSGVALGDVDGDGWCDIFLCGIQNGSKLYRNLGGLRFEDITEAAGVGCEGQASTGAALADIDGDGDLDLLVNSIGGGTRAFLNDGHGRFTEVLGSRLVRRFGSTSLALADFDGDGDLDLYVTNYRTDTYKDNAPNSKPEARLVDGKVVVTPAGRFFPVMAKAGGVEVIEQGERDFLYLNDGKGNFLPVSWTAGAFVDEDGKNLTTPPLDWGLSVMFRDLNQDGFPDIYVANDFFHFPDRIWLSDHGRRFQAAPRMAFREVSMSSMAVDVADINRDGFDDILVVDMLSREHGARHRQKANMMNGELNLPLSDPQFRPEVPRNTLFLNRGDGTYSEIAQLSGLEATEWSWGAVFLDVDLDGYEDVLIPNGNWHDVLDADTLRALSTVRQQPSPENRLRNLQRFPALPRHKLALRNQRDLTFAETGTAWGFNDLGVCTAMACADLDNDGDMDLVVNQLNGEAAIYQNRSAAPRVSVSLRGAGSNTHGIGSRVELHAGSFTQAQEIQVGGRYLSSDQAQRVFAAPTDHGPLSLLVRWRSGRVSRIADVRPNHHYEILEDPSGALEPTQPPTSAIEKPWFEDVSPRISGTPHVEKPFNDFDRQSLLSRRFSTLGPGVAWIDLDGDKRPDLVRGGGQGQPLSGWRNLGNGRFEPFPIVTNWGTFNDDTTGLAAFHTVPSGAAVLVAGLASYETNPGATNALALLASHLPSPQLLPATAGVSTGPVALADADGAGHWVLFVGGRIRPGRYPEPADSRLLRFANGRWNEDPELSAPFKNVGLVSGAVFADLNNDGFPELVLACEWGPVRVFQNQKGHFVEATENLGLSAWTGWWNGVAVGDLDGDGALDLVVSNWGRNTRFQRFLSHPLKVWHGDIDDSGTYDIIEAQFDPDLKKYVPWRSFDVVTRAIPALAQRAPTFRAYGERSVEELLGEDLKRTRTLEARTLDTMVFLNRGTHFEPKPLPAEAQFAPAFGVNVADIDGDGIEDVLLAQNFFDVEYETSRYDAGRALWLRGKGGGEFTPVEAAVSGIRVEGQQRGAAVGDYDEDGRLDWVVAQNSGELRLFHNLRGRPGHRMSFGAGKENPVGVGCVARLVYASGRRGPAKTVTAGSGYWSQDDVTLVFGVPEGEIVASIEVLWPGGRRTTAAAGRTGVTQRITDSGAPGRVVP